MSHEETTQLLFSQPRQKISPSRPRKKGGCGGCLWRFLLIGLLVTAFIVFGGAAFAMNYVSSLSAELQDGITRLAEARERRTFETTRITDRNGELLWEIIGEGRRTAIPLSKIPKALQLASIVTEDKTFYTNKGFDEPSLIAAVIANLRNPSDRPIGGSTITQQIVRHIAFDYDERVEVSYRRKLKELFLAWRMTEEYSKDEILEMYLNEIYYGNLAYGIEAAAQTYFGKSAEQLTLGESTLLAGLPQSPIGLDPFTYLEAAKARQWFILTLMIEEGVITKEQADTAYLEPLQFSQQQVGLEAPHFAVYVRQQLEQLYGAEEVANGGLQVRTTLDLRYQKMAEQIAQQQITALQGQNVTNAALVAIKPSSGEILAMLGSVDYHNEAINGAVNIALSPQQPGSTIKPITFAAAISPDPQTGQAVWNSADLVWDLPVQYPQYDGTFYVPQNYDEKFHGPIRLRTALANSYNIPALLLLQSIGVERMVNVANQMGIASLQYDPVNYGLAVTLGGIEVTPLEMAGAYTVFANGGNYIPPVSILEITRTDGEKTYQYTSPAPKPVFDPRVSYLITDFLDDDQARLPAMGEGNPLELPFPAAAKTGTTNEYRDNWTIGYTPDLVVGVWTGNTDNSPMDTVSGLIGAAPIWRDFMLGVDNDPSLQNSLLVNDQPPPTQFTPPTGLKKIPVCDPYSVTFGIQACNYIQEEWTFVEWDVNKDSSGTWQWSEPSVAKALAAPVSVAWKNNTPPVGATCFWSEGSWPQGTVQSLFLLPPRNEESRPIAYQWATERGLAVLPFEACDTRQLQPVNSFVENEAPTPWPTNTMIPTSAESTPTPTPWPTAAIAPPKSTWQPAPTKNWNATPTPKPVWEPSPTPKPAWQPSPTAEPAWQPSPTPKPAWQPSPTAEPVWQPSPTPKPVWQPSPTAEPAWQPSPTPKPVWQPSPTPEPAAWQVQPTEPPSAPPVNQTNGAAWQISSPADGQRVSGIVPILGTAQFNDQTSFYKVELRKTGQFDWITLGEIHRSSVVNGQLETLNAAGLVNSAEWGRGNYQLQLLLIQPDGNFVGVPYIISIVLE